MKGKLEFKEELQGEIVIAVYFDDKPCGFIKFTEGKHNWYRWDRLHNFSLSLEEQKLWLIELFNQLDKFKYETY